MNPDVHAVLGPTLRDFLFHDKATLLLLAVIAIIVSLQGSFRYLRWRWGDGEVYTNDSEYGLSGGLTRPSSEIASLWLWLALTLAVLLFYSDWELDWLGVARLLKLFSISGGL
jgi:hypothetical protein